MNSNEQTIAQRIANLFNNNGMAFQPRGVHLQDLLERVTNDIDQDWDDETTTYNFKDGSAICVGDCFWDVCTSVS